MEVCAVAARAGTLRRDDLGECRTARAVIQPDLAAAEVDIVRKVVPRIGSELRAPLGLAADHPTQRVVRTTCARKRTVLQLGEVRLEERDLMLIVRVRRVGRGCLEREMVVPKMNLTCVRLECNGSTHRWPVLMLALVCGMISVRSIVWPFQNAVPSIVVFRPFASLVSAGFL